MKIRKDVVAVFGGTFDPPHKGHIRLAEKIIESSYADRVIFMPAFKPPHKPDAPVSAFKHRLNMLALAIRGRAEFSVSEIESVRSGPSYTYDTMCELARLHPDSEIKLLLGSDSLKLLHTWYKSEDLVKNWKLLVYPRRGYDVSKDELCANWDMKVAEKLLGYILPLPFHDYASTDIRAEIIGGGDAISMLDSAILDYILKNNLYIGK